MKGLNIGKFIPLPEYFSAPLNCQHSFNFQVSTRYYVHIRGAAFPARGSAMNLAHVVLAPCLLRDHLREATAYMRKRVVKKRADDVAWSITG